jgi:hypothetical protein
MRKTPHLFERVLSMGRTVNEAFEVLITWLMPSESETAAAATHRQTIEARLKQDFGSVRLFRSGSFGHGTSIKGYSDLDYFAVLPSSKLPSKSGTALINLKSSLAARFPQTPITIRSPVVVVPFGGGLAGERHEIAPAFDVEEKNGHRIYGIPDRGDGWMSTAPQAHGAWVNGVNNNLSGKAKQLIRLVKYWNYVQSAGIRSFYIEMRVAQYASGESTIIYDIDMLRALTSLGSHSLAAMQDPLGLVGYTYPCSDAVKPTALSKLQTAITRAEKAREASRNDKTYDAFYWWNLLFADKFPAQ